jgi:hypothetical protein
LHIYLAGLNNFRPGEKIPRDLTETRKKYLILRTEIGSKSLLALGIKQLSPVRIVELGSADRIVIARNEESRDACLLIERRDKRTYLGFPAP